MQLLRHTGEYFLLMGRVLRLPDRQRMFWRQYSKELEKQGLQSLPIVLLISVFIGAILTIQAKTNTENPLLPTYITGLLTRDTLLLEFSSTILCLILAGKVGSNIASEIGTMRVTEQIDALEIMGVNSANYLILPKILAFMSMMPFLFIISTAAGLIGGYGVGAFTDIITIPMSFGTRSSKRWSLRSLSRAWRVTTVTTPAAEHSMSERLRLTLS